MPRVVIIGGGFGGLFAARRLRREDVQVTLIDRKNHHVFQPLLYQVATATLSPGDIAAPIRWILRRVRNVHVLMAEARRIDVNARRVELADGAALDYDYLIVASGSRHAYFGHGEWEADAPGLKTLEDAIAIRRRLLVAFERAEREARAELGNIPPELQSHPDVLQVRWAVHGAAKEWESAAEVAEAFRKARPETAGGRGTAPRRSWPVSIRTSCQSEPGILRRGFRPRGPIGRRMFDGDLLAVVVAIMPRVRGLEMHGAVMTGHDLLPVGPMARLHFMCTGRLRLRGLTTLLRRCSGRRCGERRRP
jgi:2-polyprenyl-6-methoxyphenol hydroxylase-like FAD-dependent oxidoreductase